jgi:subfamily B ATP-binding cassette protein MsbA
MQILKRLFGLLRPYSITLTFSALLLVGRAALELVPPIFQRLIVDEIIGARDLSRLAAAAVWLVCIYTAQQVINGGDMYVRHALGQKLILDLRVRLYAYLQRLSLSFFERTSTGELMSRVTNDVNALENFVTHGSALTAVDLLRLLGGATVLILLDWRLALLVLIPVPLLAAALRVFNSRIRPIYRQVRARLGDINAQLQDNLSGIQVVQAFGQEDRQLARFTAESESYYRARVEGIRAWMLFFPAMRFLSSMGTVLVLVAGAFMVVRGQLSLGTLVAFLAYVTSFYEPINRLVEVDNTFQEAIAAGERVFELLDTPPEIQDPPAAQHLEEVRGQVVFDNVSFRYGTGDEVLHQVSFVIEPGQVVALVGPSGAGKTSIANLLCRFYDPVSGRVLVDGHDLRTLQVASLRRRVAVVLQDTFLFNASIRENLLVGKPDSSNAELESACRTANAHDFVAELPQGYNTEVGERGVRLSGGQKQRLALARAILADPRILILDEATSSVDSEAEYLIQQALDSVLQGRTALVIAHRLSTIRNADKIVALDSGQVREIGNHQDLMESGGLYSQLYRRQLELVAVRPEVEPAA